MRVIYNILLPPFLKRLNFWLLNHYPVVWRTQVIFLFYYGFILSILMFFAGFFYPVDAQNLTVHPIQPIVFGYDSYYLLSAFFIGSAIYYWAYRQVQTGFPFPKMYQTLITLCIYTVSFYFLFAWVIPAFRLGTIVKTAYYWVPDADIDRLNKLEIYPYGFTLFESDSIFSDTLGAAFFTKREAAFKSIFSREEDILQHRYDLNKNYWVNLFRNKINYARKSKQAGLFYLSDRTTLGNLLNLYRSGNKTNSITKEELSNRSTWSYLAGHSYNAYSIAISQRDFRSYLHPRTYITYLSDMSCLSNLADFAYLSDTTNHSYRQYLSYHIYRNFLVGREDLHNLGELANASDQAFLPLYSNFKKVLEVPRKYDELNFAKHIESKSVYSRVPDTKVITTSKLYNWPKKPGSVENLIRSVKHAKLYIQEKIYFRFIISIISYIFLPALLLFFLHFLEVKYVWLLSIIIFSGAVLIAFQLPPYHSLKTSRLISTSAFLFVPVASLLWIGTSAILKKQLPYLIFAVNSLFFGILVVLTSSLFIIFRVKFNFDVINTFQPPYDLAFYSVQVIGLIGAVLTTYVKTLPKA